MRVNQRDHLVSMEATEMTFIEFLKVKKDIDPEARDMDELMAEHYDEYTDYLMHLKEGCDPE